MAAEKKIGPAASGTPVDEDVSHEREKRAAPDRVEMYVADFRRRAEGLSGDALEVEIMRLTDRIIERQLAMAPEGVRPDLREELKRLLQNDPAFAPMLTELRRSAAAKK
jgi:hypothetical protein